jgi:UDP:flavonoid glycosyltransferase YjiC (YdhE family)
MARVLFAWELGTGLGHLSRFRPVAHELLARGHDVRLALRDLSRAADLYDPGRFPLYQAPVKTALPVNPIEPPRTFADILHNVGFERPGELLGMASAWQRLFEAVNPDLVVADHSPVTLVALRGLPIRRVTFGNGFFSPPDTECWPDLRWWLPGAPDLHASGAHVLGVANEVLAGLGAPTLHRLGQLYREVDDTILLTLPELDPYGPRPGVSYWGPLSDDAGGETAWPPGPGPRVFVYLRECPGLVTVLSELAAGGWPVVAYCPDLPADVRRDLTSPTLTFAAVPVGIRRAAAGCDVAVLSGTASLTQVLLAGKPVACVPLQVEQLHVAEAVRRMGAGLVVPVDGSGTAVAIDELTRLPEFRTRAREFAARYAELDPHEQVNRVTDRLAHHAGG